jgi:hypothetical protein
MHGTRAHREGPARSGRAFAPLLPDGQVATWSARCPRPREQQAAAVHARTRPSRPSCRPGHVRPASTVVVRDPHDLHRQRLNLRTAPRSRGESQRLLRCRTICEGMGAFFYGNGTRTEVQVGHDVHDHVPACTWSGDQETPAPQRWRGDQAHVFPFGADVLCVWAVLLTVCGSKLNSCDHHVRGEPAHTYMVTLPRRSQINDTHTPQLNIVSSHRMRFRRNSGRPPWWRIGPSSASLVVLTLTPSLLTSTPSPLSRQLASCGISLVASASSLTLPIVYPSH